MNFHMVPFEHRDVKAKLSSRFGIRGVPSLVILEPTGEIITKAGRNEISADPDGISFPWHPKTLGELLGHVFLYNKTEVMSASDLSGKVLALFFTAHWSAPARAFTKELLAVYKRLREAKQPFEVIFGLFALMLAMDLIDLCVVFLLLCGLIGGDLNLFFGYFLESVRRCLFLNHARSVLRQDS
eukprot:m.666595 g.666595  ORF g.666595 m.666595 type:complete len:184 (+) comp58502_c0_seq2:629-1180(+)